MKDGGWQWFWRLVALIAAVFMICTVLMFWSAWRASPFEPSANQKPLENGIDVIAIQLDILSLLIAVVAIALGFLGFVGYQSIREGAIKKAQEAAEEEVRNFSPPIIRREVQEFLRAFPKEAPISDAEIDAIVEAVGKEGENGKE
jgi:amino acid transporter